MARGQIRAGLGPRLRRLRRVVIEEETCPSCSTASGSPPARRATTGRPTPSPGAARHVSSEPAPAENEHVGVRSRKEGRRRDTANATAARTEPLTSRPARRASHCRPARVWLREAGGAESRGSASWPRPSARRATEPRRGPSPSPARASASTAPASARRDTPSAEQAINSRATSRHRSSIRDHRDERVGVPVGQCPAILLTARRLWKVRVRGNDPGSFAEPVIVE
jgi:hypothetical protein